MTTNKNMYVIDYGSYIIPKHIIIWSAVYNQISYIRSEWKIQAQTLMQMFTLECDVKHPGHVELFRRKILMFKIMSVILWIFEAHSGKLASLLSLFYNNLQMVLFTHLRGILCSFSVVKVKAYLVTAQINCETPVTLEHVKLECP